MWGIGVEDAPLAPKILLVLIGPGGPMARKLRQRHVDAVVGEIVALRRRAASRFNRLADESLGPGDAVRPGDGRTPAGCGPPQAVAGAASRAILVHGPAGPRASTPDMVFFAATSTMEAAYDDAFLDVMRGAHIKGALVGVEAVTPEGLNNVYKGFNDSGEALVTGLAQVPRAWCSRALILHLRPAERLRLPRWRPPRHIADWRWPAPLRSSRTPHAHPGTVHFAAWEKKLGNHPTKIPGIPVMRRLAYSTGAASQGYALHPLLCPGTSSGHGHRRCGTGLLQRRARLRARSRCLISFRSGVASRRSGSCIGRWAANTGIATDSARWNRADRWRLSDCQARPVVCSPLKPMPGSADASPKRRQLAWGGGSRRNPLVR